MKHVFINARFLTQGVTGVQRYAREVVRGIDRLVSQQDSSIDGLSFELVAPKGTYEPFALQHLSLRQVGRMSGHLWEQLELPRFVRGNFLLNLCNTAPIGKTQQLVTIHDAAVYQVPQAYSRTFRALYKALLPRISRAATGILTVSEFSKRELVKYCHVSADKIRVIPLGKDHVFSAEADTRILHKLGDKPFLLAVGSMDPRKNLAGLVRALELLGETPFDVVVVGGANPAVFNQRSAALPSTVKHLGYISEGELRALYESATGFVHPALYEGFGLPPLEAMACGCPVTVSGAASLPEVCGDAALYFNPHDAEDMADKLKRLMTDPEVRASLRQKGLERAAQFSWDRCTKETVTVLQSVLVA